VPSSGSRAPAARASSSGRGTTSTPSRSTSSRCSGNWDTAPDCTTSRTPGTYFVALGRATNAQAGFTGWFGGQLAVEGTTALAASIERELTNDAPFVPLFTPSLVDLTSRRIGNYEDQNGSVLIDQLWVR